MSKGANVKSDDKYNLGVIGVSDAAIRRIYANIGIDYDSGERVGPPCSCKDPIHPDDDPACPVHHPITAAERGQIEDEQDYAATINSVRPGGM